MSIKIGGRASALARWQSEAVRELLRSAWPELEVEIITITTRGDRELDRALPDIGGKGLFTLEIERALRQGSIDVAVHSLKDLPTEEAEGLMLGAIPVRADARDVLVATDGQTLEELPAGALVGTSSPRRRAQLLQLRPDLKVDFIRGNVGTRVDKVHRGDYRAAVLAAAGLIRLEMTDHISHWFSIQEIMPAPGQGALAVQQRADDPQTTKLLAAIDQPAIRRAVEAERAFLNRLESGCSAPVGAWAESAEDEVFLRTIVATENGRDPIRLEGSGAEPAELGRRLADQALSMGAAEVISG